MPEKEDCWYTKRPIGIHFIGNFMKLISQRLDLSVVYTNHSIRATCVTVLSENGLEARHIMRVTGHRCESSLKSYEKDNSVAQKRKISEILAGQSSSRSRSSTTTASASSSTTTRSTASASFTAARSTLYPTILANLTAPPISTSDNLDLCHPHENQDDGNDNRSACIENRPVRISNPTSSESLSTTQTHLQDMSTRGLHFDIHNNANCTFNFNCS